MKLRPGWVCFVCLCLTLAGWSQNAATSSAVVSVPPIIQFSNIASDEGGTPLTGTVSITFSLYNSAVGGQALWTETQNVELTNAGQYSAYLGLTQAHGLPTNLFTSGQAQWLGVKIENQPEQPRVYLVSVPYAMKAGDAATVGGLPPSAFVMAASSNPIFPSRPVAASPTASVSPAPLGTSGVTTSGGAVGTFPLFSTSTDIENSLLAQTGTGNSTKVAMNDTVTQFGDAYAFGASSAGISGALTIFPLQSPPFLHMCCNNEPVFYNVFVGGAGNLTNHAAAENSVGVGYEALASVGTKTAKGGARGNTAVGYQSLSGTTSGTENTALGWLAGQSLTSRNANTTGSQDTFIGYASGPGSETQLDNATAIGANADVTNGNSLVLGSISGVNSATSNVNVGIGTTAPAATLDVEAPSGSSPTITFGNSSNPATFTVNGNSTFSGNVNFSAAPTFPNLNVESGTNPTLDVGTSSSAGTLDVYGVLQIGGSAFDYGSAFKENAYLGFAGNGTLPSGADNTAVGFQALLNNTTGGGNTATGASALAGNSTGSYNTASGWLALSANSTGKSNTATGAFAMQHRTSGIGNTASGWSALLSNVAGSYDTAVGYSAGTDSSAVNLSNATAVGAFADVKESNALVLGSINGTNGANANVSVGIGTTTPAATLDVEAPSGSAPTVNFGSASNPATFTVDGTSTFNGGVNFSSSLTFPALNVESSNNPTLNVGSSTIAGTFSLYGDLLIGGTIFDYGSAQAGNAFVGFAGSSGLMPAGTANTAVGFLALTSNVGATSTGSANTAVGFESLLANSTGSYNTATGYAALLSDTGSYNTATGVYALYGNAMGGENTASGYQALTGNTTGSYNTASGYQALYANTAGVNNTAIGYQSLYSNSTNSITSGNGIDNTATGYQALYSNSTGGANSGFGAYAGSTQDQSQITGGYNSFFGEGAGLTSNLDGKGNVISNATAIGANAVVGESNAIVLGGISPSVNVGIWTSVPAAPLHINGPYGAPASGQALGNNGLLLGTTADSGYKWIQSYGGALALNPEGNNVGIGTSAPDTTLSVNGSADKPGGGSWGTFSDRRLKNVDGNFSSGLDRIMKLNPILYRYKDDNGMGITDREEHVGLVAQDVQKVIPEAVTENSKGYLLVNNDPIIWAMLNAIKEQQKQIEAEKSLISRQQLVANAQQRLISAQHREISRLNRKMGALEVRSRTGRPNSTVTLASQAGK